MWTTLVSVQVTKQYQIQSWRLVLPSSRLTVSPRTRGRVVVLKFEGELFSNGFDPTYLMSDSNKTWHECEACQTQFASISHFRQCLPHFTVALIQAFCIVSVVVEYAAGLEVECRRSCDKMTLGVP